MNIGKARALFEQVASGEYHGSTVGEYLEAVKIVLDMETHNSISKKMIISVCKWLMSFTYRWIPVSERLPEEPGYYITSNEYNGVGEDFYYDGHFWNADKHAYSVIAWMPKPKAYKPNK